MFTHDCELVVLRRRQLVTNSALQLLLTCRRDDHSTDFFVVALYHISRGTVTSHQQYNTQQQHDALVN
jgi:hypothetical protein